MSDMIEIRWHGRGGQGAKTASLLLADAAFMAGQYVQSFPEYGPERSGAPITAYNRISSERCSIHSNIYYPDYVAVVDETLLESVDVTSGLKEDGAIIINSEKSAYLKRISSRAAAAKRMTVLSDWKIRCLRSVSSRKVTSWSVPMMTECGMECNRFRMKMDDCNFALV